MSTELATTGKGTLPISGQSVGLTGTEREGGEEGRRGGVWERGNRKRKECVSGLGGEGEINQ